LLKGQHKRTWNRQKVSDGYFRKEEAVMANKTQKISVSAFLTFGELSRDMIKL
jgi:hypothetical protein